MAGQTGETAGLRRETAESESDWLVEAVESRLRRGQTTKAVATALDELRREGKLDWAPSERTIRSWIATGKVRRPVRPDDPWSLLNGHPDDVPLVLPVLPLIAHLSRAGRWLSIREGEVIARIRRAAPGLPLAAAVTLGDLYVRRERERKPTTDLDLYLAAGAWQWHGEGVEEWTWKATRYLRLAMAAGVPAIYVSRTTPGDALIGVTGTVTVSGGPADGSWKEFSHEVTTEEVNERALDFIANVGLSEGGRDHMARAAYKRKERMDARHDS